MDLSTPLSAIMTTDLIIVRPSDLLKVAADAFRKNNIHHLPVVDETGKLVGILSKSDFLRVGSAWKAFQQNKGHIVEDDYYHEKITIGKVMTKEVVKLTANDTISIAMGVFKENLFHSIPIVEKDLLVGLVTTYDLLKFAFRENGLD
ncbi:MAG: CBS domain-containing protein [Saprospirales bacterium]|nr:CBS domain-containing protein [Saprospirales bacterium]MBK8493029.1 CBS domain-containing protein [Saprospirales bacterium]